MFRATYDAREKLGRSPLLVLVGVIQKLLNDRLYTVKWRILNELDYK